MSCVSSRFCEGAAACRRVLRLLLHRWRFVLTAEMRGPVSVWLRWVVQISLHVGSSVCSAVRWRIPLNVHSYLINNSCLCFLLSPAEKGRHECWRHTVCLLCTGPWESRGLLCVWMKEWTSVTAVSHLLTPHMGLCLALTWKNNRKAWNCKDDRKNPCLHQCKNSRWGTRHHGNQENGSDVCCKLQNDP